MAERIPADMDAFLREHAARATPLPEVRESALARWPHASDATDEQRRTHAARIETAYKHRRKRAREEARAALAETSVSIMEPITTPTCTAGDLADVQPLPSGAGPDQGAAEDSVSDTPTNGRAPHASPLSREKLQEMIDAIKSAPQVITVRSDVERLEGVVDNLAAQVGRLADAVSQMLAQAQDIAAAKDALIDTQRRYIEHLQRMVGA